MKRKILSLILVLSMILVFCACGSKTPSEQSSAPESATAEDGSGTEDVTSAQADGEKAMANFVEKLDQGDYVITSEKEYMTVVVHSPEQVIFKMNPDYNVDDYAYITLDGETFEGYLTDDGLDDVQFAGPDNAIDAAIEDLPNYWNYISEGNMFNLFYNFPENPLEFISYDDNVKLMVMKLAGINKSVLLAVEEVHMVLDAEDPTVVTFMFMVNPKYPEIKTAWSDDDIDQIEMVFMRDYGEMAVPFPDNSSYALRIDPDAYELYTSVIITDAHATEEAVESYKQKLLANGYTDMGENKFRKSLREEYNAYSELYVDYDRGLYIEGVLTHDSPKYTGLDEINGVITGFGFPALEDSENLSGWTAQNEGKERNESWVYFFDYELYMPIFLEYKDDAEAVKYFEDYGSKLAAQGFNVEHDEGSDNGKYTTPNGFTSFRFTFDENGELIIFFEVEKSLSPEEVNAIIAEHEVPAINLQGDIGARDQTKYYYNIMGFRGLFMRVYQPFDNRQEGEGFLEELTGRLEDLDYLPINPEKIGSVREHVYMNWDVGKYIGFDIYDNADGKTTVFLEIVSIEPDEDGDVDDVIDDLIPVEDDDLNGILGNIYDRFDNFKIRQ